MKLLVEIMGSKGPILDIIHNLPASEGEFHTPGGIITVTDENDSEGNPAKSITWNKFKNYGDKTLRIPIDTTGRGSIRLSHERLGERLVTVMLKSE